MLTVVAFNRTAEEWEIVGECRTRQAAEQILAKCPRGEATIFEGGTAEVERLNPGIKRAADFLKS